MTSYHIEQITPSFKTSLISIFNFFEVLCFYECLCREQIADAKYLTKMRLNEGPVYKGVAIVKGTRKGCWATLGVATAEAVTASRSEGGRMWKGKRGCMTGSLVRILKSFRATAR